MTNYYEHMDWLPATKATLHSLLGHSVGRCWHSQRDMFGNVISILDNIDCFDCKYKYERKR